MDKNTIIAIHEYLAIFFSDKEDPISPPGIKNLDTIESAAARPYATAGGSDAYPTPFLKAASLFHSIAGNHSFHNGNKRTALLSTLYFLSEYGYWISADNDELYEFTRKIAAHEITDNRNDEVSVIALWLQTNSRQQQRGEKPMKLVALRKTLGRFGYVLYDAGQLFDVLKDGVNMTSILKKGAKGIEDYDPQYIAELRKRLGLTVDNGIDSALFYGQKGINDDLSIFMQLHLDVMKRLAKI